MTGGWAEAITLVALLLALTGAVLRPRGLPEIAFAVPGVIVVVASGTESLSAAQGAVRHLLSTVCFLALILVFGQLSANAGVFDYLGAVAARACRRNTVGLLAIVVTFAALVTTVLTLDATVVLLTPVVLRSARHLGVSARPHTYACAEVANAGSLLLPVSNLTNLLAVSLTGLSFGEFARSMALPWLIACVLEFTGLWLFFRKELGIAPVGTGGDAVRLPRYGLLVLGVTVGGFVVASSFGVAPAWPALGGVVLLAAPTVRRPSLIGMVRAANLGFCAFVLALGVIVDAVRRHGLGSALHDVLPRGVSLPALLALAFIAATNVGRPPA